MPLVCQVKPAREKSLDNPRKQAYGKHTLMSKAAKTLKKRAAVRIDARLYQDAIRMMEEQRYGDFTAFIENLIRQEWIRTLGGKAAGSALGRTAPGEGPESISLANDAPAAAPMPPERQTRYTRKAT